MTGVEADERGGAGEVAGGGAGGAAGSEEVVVEGVGGARQEVRWLVAGAARLDGAAVGAAVGPAGPVDGRLQRAVLGVVLRDAPQLPAAAAADRPRAATDGRADGEEEEEEGEWRDYHHHWARTIWEWKRQLELGRV